MSISRETVTTRETDTGSTRSGFSSLQDSHSRYMSMYSDKCDDEVLRLGNEVPNFDAQTTQGPMNFHQWKEGKWAILFSHPADFTPVCTTELASLANKHAELQSMGCKVAALSVDPVEKHKQWLQDVVAQHHPEDIKVDFPIIADTDRYISTCYGMLDQWADPFNRESNTMDLTIRSVFIINPEHKLMLRTTYPACVGRNTDEIVRCVKALQLSYNKSIATPADWPNNHQQVKLADGTTTTDYKGSVFLLPAVTKEEAKKHYPGYHTVEVPSNKAYLRLVKAEDVGSVPTRIFKEEKQIGRKRKGKKRRKQKTKTPISRSIVYWFCRVIGKSSSVASS